MPIDKAYTPGLVRGVDETVHPRRALERRYPGTTGPGIGIIAAASQGPDSDFARLYLNALIRFGSNLPTPEWNAYWDSVYAAARTPVLVEEPRWRRIGEMLLQPEWGASDTPLILSQGLAGGTRTEIAALGAVIAASELVEVMLHEPPVLYQSKRLNRIAHAAPVILSGAGLALAIANCLDLSLTLHTDLDTASLGLNVTAALADRLLEGKRRSDH
jgi:hypothetical protein